MDAGLQIKELAEMIGVNEGTVINWEIRGMNPSKRYQERLQGFLGEYYIKKILEIAN